jgi:hypothetical protein
MPYDLSLFWILILLHVLKPKCWPCARRDTYAKKLLPHFRWRLYLRDPISSLLVGKVHHKFSGLHK